MTDASTTARMIVDKAVRMAHPNVAGDNLTLARMAYAIGRAAEYARSPRFGPDHDMTIGFREFAEFLAQGPHDDIQRRVTWALEDQADTAVAA